MIYKVCVRCRARNTINCKTYSEKHPDTNKEYYDKEERAYYNKQYREHADRLKEHDRARNQIKVDCPHCNGDIAKIKLSSHLQSHKCKKETASK